MVDKNNVKPQDLMTNKFPTKVLQFMGIFEEGVESGKFAKHREHLNRDMNLR